MEKLARINLIAGQNNVGKTALLEALFLHAGAYNPALILTLNVLRGVERTKVDVMTPSNPLWDYLFYKINPKAMIRLSGSGSVNENRVLELDVVRKPEEISQIRLPRLEVGNENGNGTPYVTNENAVKVLRLRHTQPGQESGAVHLIQTRDGIESESHPEPPFQAIFVPSGFRFPPSGDAERYGELDRINKQQIVLDVLRLIEPRIVRLSAFPVGGVYVLHGDIGLGELIPVTMMGEGTNRLLSFILAIASSGGGVVFIDEIESGLHYSVQRAIWKALYKAAVDFNVQVFSTTHSRECINAAYEAFTEIGEYDFLFHRLVRGESGNVQSITYDQIAMQGVKQLELEVRG